MKHRSANIIIVFDALFGTCLDQTDGHNWHVHSERTGTDGPTPSCDEIQGHYNPYEVNLMTNYPQLCNSSGVTRYPLRLGVQLYLFNGSS